MAKILVVDGEPSILSLIRFLLERSGHSVSGACDGQVALEVLGVEPENASASLPDLVVLDVMMPILDGLAVAKAMSSHPRACRVPIIIVTAKGDMRGLFEAMPQVAGFFLKPLDPKLLRETVARLTARK